MPADTLVLLDRPSEASPRHGLAAAAVVDPTGVGGIDVTDLGFTRGDGVFETINLVDGRLQALDAHLDRVCDDWSHGVDHGMDWPTKILACKYDVVNRAWAVVDAAFDLTGGAGIFRTSRFEQMFRDARLGRIHPGNSLLTHEIVGKLSLGINPDEQPRWG